MPTEAKRETIDELRAELGSARTMIVSEYRGLKVKEITEIRRALRKQNVTYRVVKNRLMRIAAEDSVGEALSPLLTGPTAIAFGTDEAATAKAVLTAAGHVVNVTEVVAVEVSDRPGGLVEVLETIGAAGVNVEYMYAFTFKRGERGALLFRFDDADKAIASLKAKGIGVFSSQELFGLLEAGAVL